MIPEIVHPVITVPSSEAKDHDVEKWAEDQARSLMHTVATVLNHGFGPGRGKEVFERQVGYYSLCFDETMREIGRKAKRG